MNEIKLNNIIKLYNTNKITLEELITYLLKEQHKQPNPGIVKLLVNSLSKKKNNFEFLTIIYQDELNTLVGFNETKTIAFTITNNLTTREYHKTGPFFEDIKLLTQEKNSPHQSAHTSIITSISNYKIGINEVYEFDDKTPLNSIIYNPTKYKYYKFTKDGKIQKEYEINQKYNEMIEIHSNKENPSEKNYSIYNITKMTKEELSQVPLEELKKNNSIWKIKFLYSLVDKKHQTTPIAKK